MLQSVNVQNGLSRQLCEMWCTDARNGCVIAGYCVEGTLAKELINGPDEVLSYLASFCHCADQDDGWQHCGAQDERGLHLLLGTHRLHSDKRLH